MRKLVSIGFSLCLTLASLTAKGTPLNPGWVDASAKWLIHADMDAFKKTGIGGMVYNALKKDVLEGFEKDMTEKLGVSMAFDKIQAITAYGSSFHSKPEESGVIILQSRQDMKPILKALLDTKHEYLTIKQVTKGDLEMISLNDEVFCAVFPGNKVVVGKAVDKVLKASSVISGKSPNIQSDDQSLVMGFPESKDAFFFLAIAEGFNSSEGHPMQAKLFRNTEGVKLTLGATSKLFLLNIFFKTIDQEKSEQLKQVVEGMVALGRLSQENEEVIEVLNSTKIKSSKNIVSVKASFPTGKVMERLKDK